MLGWEPEQVLRKLPSIITIQNIQLSSVGCTKAIQYQQMVPNKEMKMFVELSKEPMQPWNVSENGSKEKIT